MHSRFGGQNVTGKRSLDNLASAEWRAVTSDRPLLRDRCGNAPFRNLKRDGGDRAGLGDLNEREEHMRTTSAERMRALRARRRRGKLRLEVDLHADDLRE